MCSFCRHNRFNKSIPLILKINTTACHGTENYIKYIEHVQIHTSLYHYRRGATEISVKSPHGTVSWVLKMRSNDLRGGQFNQWDFLSTHFWGENPTGTWTVSFYSTGKINVPLKMYLKRRPTRFTIYNFDIHGMLQVSYEQWDDTKIG